jgi:hypothetical protein
MNRYKPSIPHAAFGMAAVAMTAITIGLLVVLPANMEPGSQEIRMLAASKVATPASTGVVTGSENIDVVAVPEEGFSAVPCISNPNRKPEG